MCGYVTSKILTIPVDITKLEPEQLIQLRKQFEDEMEHFSTSLSALNMALGKYKECINNVKQVSTEGNEGKELLVPLSGSLYVPGKVKDNNKFLVDVGTGYYIEKSSEDAIKFFEGKVTQLNKDSTKVTEIITEKSRTIQRLDQVLREKVHQREMQAAKSTANPPIETK